MYTTIEQVKELTGYDVTQETVIMAQAIMESWTGRIETDVVSPNDRGLLSRGTAYQAAYMHVSGNTVFEQVDFKSITQFGQSIVLKDGSPAPFIASLAMFACRSLSWRRVRSVKTGSLFDRKPELDSGWLTE